MAGKSLKENKVLVDAKIREACAKAGRAPSSVQILCVTKGHSVDVVREAMALGLNDCGENYVQEWSMKAQQVSGVNWHFIGHLQSNKVKQVVGHVALIHSVDRDGLARVVGDRALQLGQRQSVLVEVNIAGEKSKTGLPPPEAESLLRQLATHAGLSWRGLMVMPPSSEDAEVSRPYFKQAAELFRKFRVLVPGHPWDTLSMGTSQDFAVAVEEGATLVRLGTVLFGPRS